MINSKLHGIIDYLVVIFLALSPSLFALPPLAATIAYALAAIHFALTLFTGFELGIIKIIPFRIHGWIELIVSVALVGVAFYLGKEEGMLARNFYLCFAAAVFITWALTNYKGSATV